MSPQKIAVDAVRRADVTGTMLQDCYPEILCEPRQRFREIDGTCNNLREPILGKVTTRYLIL